MKKGLIKKVVACALLGIMTMGFVGCGASDNKTTAGNKGEGKDLLNTIQGKVQTFVSTTSVDGIHHDTLKQADIFKIDNGVVIEKPN